jgi:ATP/maltotriose-dependent transcriptional regulator MalT
MLNTLALGYELSGESRRAAEFFRRCLAIAETVRDPSGVAVYLSNLCNPLRLTGALHAAEATAFRGLIKTRDEQDKSGERFCLRSIGLARATRGFVDGDVALHRSLRIGGDAHVLRFEGYLAQASLWRGDAVAARQYANRAWDLAKDTRLERDFIRAARLQGQAALALGDRDLAEERLHYALRRARAINHIEPELAVLAALAALHARRGDPARGREYLDAVWDAAERGPYPLLHADASNVLAEIEIHEGNRDAAIAAATAAYRLAWCDGPPFAYDYGLRTARAHLRALGAPEPEMPPYDASQHEPIEEIPIEPMEDEQAV